MLVGRLCGRGGEVHYESAVGLGCVLRSVTRSNILIESGCEILPIRSRQVPTCWDYLRPPTRANPAWEQLVSRLHDYATLCTRHLQGIQLRAIAVILYFPVLKVGRRRDLDVYATSPGPRSERIPNVIHREDAWVWKIGTVVLSTCL